MILALKYSPRLAQKSCPAPRSMAQRVARNSSSRSRLRPSCAAISWKRLATGVKASATFPPCRASSWQRYSWSVILISSGNRLPGAETTTNRRSSFRARMSRTI